MHRDVVTPRQVGEPRDRLANGHVSLAVENDAHRALVRVLGEQHDRLAEVRVDDRG